MESNDKLYPETNAVRIQTAQTPQMEHSTPLFLTSSFCYHNAEEMQEVFAGEREANVYSRFVNPTVNEFASKMASLEHTEAAFATASGMSAVFASFMAFLNAGDHLIAGRSVFGSTHSMLTKLLPRWGITHSYFDTDNIGGLEELIRPSTRMIFLETPSNPGLDLVDLEYVGHLARKHQLILNVDNCFATPALQQPAKFGADLVTHSATKWIDGQGRVLGGVVCGPRALVNEIYSFCRNTGPALSPFNAWVLSKSLETLFVRMERHCGSALHIATSLQDHPQLESVKYPFLSSHPQYAIAKKQMSAGGGIVCFEVKGGVERGKRFLDALQLFSMTANLGDTRSIATHPASTTHAKLSEEERRQVGISPGLIRLSIGLEHPTDILNDLLQALEKSS
ncbi:MAG TPA: aminotransferase class I/II-fold pyridoxal phosphate-dependent enzyme [Chitinophagaceae bacterium]|jgi:O-succinylhomoserine sulfhydrylase|nr:aminotransferase class I/II-fold pyridoxal phosphate-dependent enzyme [Chitinophagaceae bacterium]